MKRRSESSDVNLLYTRRSISIATAPGLSNSFFTFPRTNSESVFSNASMSRKKLEIQPCGHSGKEILETIHLGIRYLPELNQYTMCALVCGAGRRQGERSPDYFADHSRHIQKIQHALSANQFRTQSGIAFNPNPTDRTRRVEEHLGGYHAIVSQRPTEEGAAERYASEAGRS